MEHKEAQSRFAEGCACFVGLLQQHKLTCLQIASRISSQHPSKSANQGPFSHYNDQCFGARLQDLITAYHERENAKLDGGKLQIKDVKSEIVPAFLNGRNLRDYQVRTRFQFPLSLSRISES